MAKQQKYRSCHGNTSSHLQVPNFKKFVTRSASLDCEDCNDQESVDYWKKHTNSKLIRSATTDSGIDVTKDLSTIGSPENGSPLLSDSDSEKDNSENNNTNEKLQPIMPSMEQLRRDLQKCPTEVQAPFIKPVQIFEVDSSGATLTGFDEIIIDIPPDAISHDYDINKAHLEVGVCLYGPFQFQEKCRLISPILRLCMQEGGVALKKPIKVTLPHILSELSKEELKAFGVGFAKAKHDYIINESGSKVHVFEPSLDEASYLFSDGKAYGILQTTHFCYLCLQAELDRQVTYNAGYCLSRVHGPSTVWFYVTYFLDTCLEALRKQLHENENADGGGSYSSVIVAKYRFKLVNHDDLQVSCNPREAVAMEPANGMIRIADIDFWNRTLAEMEREHKHNIYPPRVKMAVLPRFSPQLLQQLSIKFCNGKGELKDLEAEIPLDSIINNAGPGLPSSDASFTQLKQSADSNDVSDYYQVDTVAKPTITTFWELKQIHESEINGDGVTVAILDSSININHKAFANIKLDGKNFIADERDDFWYTNREPHGTMVAGIVAKIAPKAKIYVCCVADNKDYKREAVIQALTELAETRRADIIVMSFGCRRCTDEEKAKASGDEKIKYKLERRKLIDKLVKRGVFCVAAVGNQGLYGPGIASPACLPNVLAVGALNKQGYPSQLNNPGKGQIDVYAPGENVSAPTSIDNKNYQVVSGTSCAAPAIAGIMALLLQCASFADVRINNIETLKSIFEHMHKKIDDTKLLCPVEFFEKWGKQLDTVLKELNQKH